MGGGGGEKPAAASEFFCAGLVSRPGRPGLFRFADSTDRSLLVVGILASVVQGATWPTWGFFFGELTEGLYDPDPDTAMRKTQDASILFLWLALMVFIVTVLSTGCFELVAERQVVRFRREYFQAILRQDIEWFDQHGGLELPSSIAGDTQVMKAGVGEKLAQIISAISSFCIAFTFGFFRGWQLTLVMCGCVPFLAISSKLSRDFLSSMATRGQKFYGQAGRVAEENLGNIRTVVSFGGEVAACAQYDQHVDDACATGLRAAHVGAVSMGMVQLINFCSYGAAFWFGGVLITDLDGIENTWTGKNWEGSDVMAVFWMTLIGGMMLGQIGPGVKVVLSASGAASKFYSIVANRAAIDLDAGETPAAATAGGCTGGIVFENVTFRYPTRRDIAVLQGLSFTIAPGVTTALVGESGSGKSTILSLVQRFYNVNSGAIKLDGRPITELNVRWLRSVIGLVSQEPVLFAASIRDNIQYGMRKEDVIGATSEAILAQIEEAATKANADGFIKKLVDGYDSYVGEKGAQISGGQKQRVAIARALIRRPKILLLDEATSALDNISQGEVQETLDEIMSKGEMTCIVIAHRLSTIQNATTICVFDRGTLVDSGTHEELMAKGGGLYKKLVEEQVEASKAPAAAATGKSSASAAAAVAGAGSQMSPAAAPGAGASAEEVTMLLPGSVEKTGEDDTDGEKEKVATTKDILAVLGSRSYLLGLALLAAVVSGVAMPLWGLFITDIMGAFYMCTRWDPQELDTEAWQSDDSQQTVGTWLAEKGFSANTTVVYGFDAPLGKGAYANFAECADEQASECAKYALLFCSLGLGLGLSEYSKLACFDVMKERVACSLRKVLFRAIIHQEVGFFDDETNKSGSLTSRLSADTTLVSGIAGPNIGAAIQSLATLVLALVIAFWTAWQLGLVMLTVVPLMAISGVLMQNVHKKLSGVAQEGAAKAGHVASEVITGIRTVKAFGIEADVMALYESYINGDPSLGKKKALTSGVGGGVAQAIMFLAYFAGFYYGGWLLKHAGYSGDDIMQTFMGMMMAGWGIGMAQTAVPDQAKAAEAAQIVFKILWRQSKIDSAKRITPTAALPAQLFGGVEVGAMAEFKGGVELKDITFAYPAQPDLLVLSGVSLSIAPGKMTALVGPSGSGKSTLIALLQRFYDVGSGELLLDGKVALAAVDVGWWRTQVGLVSQEPVLFNCTIAENILYGKPDATQEEVEAASRAAFAHDFILAKCPQGYATNVGEAGLTLSGGQKQRIAIARALVRKPKLLLLDEATSALDANSEREVQTAIDAISQGGVGGVDGLAICVIAHRLNTVRKADNIVVLQSGKIVEQGTHEQLMANEQGLYRSMAGQRSGASKPK